ncbi:MAG: caspase family protein [Planctomycetota bacterium]|nr:caspase family protein [Planctomycetota bacterium]
MRKLGLVLAVLGVLGCGRAFAGDARALIVSGDPGLEPDAATRFADWTARWKKLLTETYGFKAENVRVLRAPALKIDGKPAEDVPEADLCSHENVLKALGALAQAGQDGDQTVLILIGHGYGSQGLGKICLPGKDLDDVEAAKALKGLKGRLVCLNTAPASSPWAKSLAGPGRVTLTATVSDTMASVTYYSEFLLLALEPGRVNLLDAFNASSARMIRWYQNQFMEEATKKKADQSKLIMTVNGKENLALWKKLYPSKPVLAGTDDPIESSNNFEAKEAWQGRRVLSELPGLEDNGDGEVASVFSDSELEEEGRAIHSLPAKDQDGVKGDGHLAKTTVLGKP